MSGTKTVAVIGSCGAQGNGVVHGLSGKAGYAVRAITRNVDSDKAKALAAMPGVSLVKADLDDPKSLEAAFAGCYGVFCVTNFWEHFSPAKESAQVANVAAAAKAAGVQHVVWSTLENARDMGAGDTIPDIENGGVKYKVPHFEGKGLADKAFADAGVPTTYLLTSFYFDNMIHFGMGPKKGEDGVAAITFPQKETDILPCIAAKDIGLCAAGIFQDPSLIGKRVGIVGDFVTCVQIAKCLSDALGMEVKFNSVPADVYRSFGFPGADDLGNMFQWQSENNAAFVSRRDLTLSKKLNPNLQSAADWCKEHADAIKATM